jgi:hypothetical protein
MWQQLAAGALLGGGLGAAFGGGKRTGIGKAFAKQQAFHELAIQRGIQNFNTYGGQQMDAFRSVSPTFAALESRALGDLNDTTRTARLEEAFANRLAQQQGSMGLARSPTAALRTSFAGVQFGEQMRQQAFGNLMGFQGQFGQPLAMGIMGSSFSGIPQDFGMQGLALEAGAINAKNQSILGGISSGMGMGMFMGGGGGGARPSGMASSTPSGGGYGYTGYKPGSLSAWG